MSQEDTVKLLSFKQGGFERIGWLQEEEQTVLAFNRADINAPHTMLDVIKRGPYALQQLRSSQEELQQFRIDELELLPPIASPGAIFCAENNHTMNSSVLPAESVDIPAISMRLARNMVAPDQALIVPTTATSLAWNGGLAAIIGKRGRYISAGHASEHIFAYCIYSEGVVSGSQGQASQCGLGNNYEASASYGPVVVTTDELTGPYQPTITTHIGGTGVLEASISSGPVQIAQMIERVSSAMELQPGDIICSGFPVGIESGQQQQVVLKDGEAISVSISSLGTLQNPIKAENTDRNPVACSC